MLHDALCPMTPPAFIAECVARAVERGCVVVGVRPVTDTVKVVDGRRRRRDRRPRRAWSRSPRRSCCRPRGRRPRRAAQHRLRRRWSPSCVAATRSSWSRRRRRPAGSARSTTCGCSRRSRRSLSARARSSGKVILRFVGLLGTAATGQVGVARPAGRGVGAVEAVRVGRACTPRAARPPGTPAASARRRARAAASRPSTGQQAGQPDARGSRRRARGRPRWSPRTAPARRAAGRRRGSRPRRSSPASISGAQRPQRGPLRGVPGGAAVDDADLARRRGAGASAAATSSRSPGRTTTSTRRTSAQRASASRTDQASTGTVAERQQHLVGAGADPGAGAGGEDHDGGGHPGGYRSRRECFHGCYTAKQVLDASPLRSADQEGASDDACCGPRAEEWQPVCRVVELEVERGATALVHGQAIAIFRTQDDEVYALGNHDPFAKASVIARGHRRGPRRRAVRRLAGAPARLRPAQRPVPRRRPRLRPGVRRPRGRRASVARSGRAP